LSSSNTAHAGPPIGRDARYGVPRVHAARSTAAPALPPPAGPITAALFDVLRGGAREAGAGLDELGVSAVGEPLGDDDFQLALYALYELHYRGFAGVGERWEWDPDLLAFRARLEAVFEDRLAAAVPPGPSASSRDMDLALRAILDAADDGPSLSRYLETRATLSEFMEFVVHRSAYQLKEADPHSWALPRLSGRPKAAMVAIQNDEYGDGVVARAHSELFGGTLLALGLRSGYGAYLELIPGVTLATVNLMSLFGLHRRRRGAIVGHLAAFEMSSAVPNGRYSRGLERLGCARARPFFDEHVVADSVHEHLAAVDLAGGLAGAEPHLTDDILFGARALVELDRRFAAALLGAWAQGSSSLRAPLTAGE
jgi:hypothetical protein